MWRALRRYWAVIPMSMAASVLVGLGVAMLWIKPSYTARATILWEPHSDGDATDRNFLTQVDSIKLASNLQEVKRRLRSTASVEDLKDKVKLLFDGQSHLVAVETTDATAAGAQRFASTVVDVFLDYQRSIGRDRGSEHLRRVEADLNAAQAQLEVARKQYDAFRDELGVADYETELKLALSKVAELKHSIETNDTEVDTETARQAQLSAELTRQPEMSVSGQTMNAPDSVALANAQSQLATESAHLSPDHPMIQRLKREVATLSARVKHGDNQMVRGAVAVTQNQQHAAAQAGLQASKVAQGAALERREGYKRLLQDAELRLAQLSAAQGRAQPLLAAVHAEESHRSELEALRVRVLDQVRNAAPDFRVVTPASLPDKPNSSTRRNVLLRFPIAACVLSLLSIIAYELRGLRVHTAREAGFWANAAVVASSTWPREQVMLNALVDELSDVAPLVRGTTLVVGARINEVPLAREVAYWLSRLTRGWSEQGSVIGAAHAVGVAPPHSAHPSAVVTSTAEDVANDVSPGPARAVATQPTVSKSVALARVSRAPLVLAQAWDGPSYGPSLRRAARLADRVLVVVAAGTLSCTEMTQLRQRLGRDHGIGLLLVGLHPDYITLPDRVGEVERFWEDVAA